MSLPNSIFDHLMEPKKRKHCTTSATQVLRIIDSNILHTMQVSSLVIIFNAVAVTFLTFGEFGENFVRAQAYVHSYIFMFIYHVLSLVLYNNQ